MLEDEHPDWLDPVTRFPLASMEPLEEYEEDCDSAPEEIQREIDENRRAWANCKDVLRRLGRRLTRERKLRHASREGGVELP